MASNFYFLEDTSDWVFQEDMQNECKKGKTERQVLANYYASWIPWEACDVTIIARKRAMAGE